MKLPKKYQTTLLMLLTPIAAVLFASLLGSVVILLICGNPLEVYSILFSFSLGRADSVAAVFFKATPLIFAGLAVAISFRVGLFNIGTEGQYLIGTLAAAWAGFAFKGLPAFIHLPLVVVFGMVGGMLWAIPPIYLKLKRGVHEVISTIMLNYIALSLIHFLIVNVFLDKNQGPNPIMRMPGIEPSAYVPTLHGLLALFGLEIPHYVYLNWFLPVGLLVAFIIYIIIWRTPFGYEVRAVSSSPDAAATARVNVNATYFKAFLLSGAIGGLIGLSHLLSYSGYMDLDFPKGYGFSGIAIALMGRNHPAGVVVSALLFGFLSRGAQGVQAFAGVPKEVISILEAIMILSIVVAYELLTRYLKTQRKKEASSL